MGASVAVAAFVAMAVAGQRQVDINKNQGSGGGGGGQAVPPVGKKTVDDQMQDYGEGGNIGVGAHHFGGRTGLEEGYSVLTKGRTASTIAPNKKRLQQS